MAPLPPWANTISMLVALILAGSHAMEEGYSFQAVEMASKVRHSHMMELPKRRLAQPPAPSLRRLDADLEWDISRQAGYPRFHITGDHTGKDITFKFDVTGTEAPNFGVDKMLVTSLWKIDCATTVKSPSAKAAIVHHDSIDPEQGVLTVDLGLDMSAIANSPYYRQVNITHGDIEFCFRLDYVHYDPVLDLWESVNDFEDQITITVGLTAEFHTDQQAALVGATSLGRKQRDRTSKYMRGSM